LVEQEKKGMSKLHLQKAMGTLEPPIKFKKADKTESLVSNVVTSMHTREVQTYDQERLQQEVSKRPSEAGTSVSHAQKKIKSVSKKTDAGCAPAAVASAASGAAAGRPLPGSTGMVSRNEIEKMDSESKVSKHKGKFDPKFGGGKRVALCIGIDDYPSNSRLPNCVNDAQDMHDCCQQKLRFDTVTVLKNANKMAIVDAVRNLRDSHIEHGSLVFFFLSGHGVEYEGVNYVLPLEMRSTNEEDYATEAVSVDFILRELSSFTATVNVVLLDCCRENEYNNTFKSSKGARGGRSKGFGENLRSRGRNAEFLIGLACDPGCVALPNDLERNSIYTEALLRHLPIAGRTLEETMKAIRIDVFRKTCKKQRPWDESCVMQNVVLVPQ